MKVGSVNTSMFFDMEKYVYSEIVFNTLSTVIKQILKKFPSDKLNCAKNALFFPSRAPTHHSFAFTLRFLYELKRNVSLSKTGFWDFPFWIPFRFYESLYFCSTIWFNKIHGLFNVITPFKIKIIEKPHTVLLPDV